MSDRERALRVLRGPAVRLINFSFIALDERTTVSVDFTTFERVAAAIERGGAVRGGINLIFRQRIPYDDAQAMYLPQGDWKINPPFEANTLLVNPIRGVREEGALIHEAVHASFDLTFSRLRVIDSETAAYIAIALYNRITGYNPRRPRWQLRTNAYAVADSVLRTGRIDPIALSNLRNSVATDPVYGRGGINTFIKSDG